MTTSSGRDPDVQALLDKQAIYEVMTRYARALDRCDAELLRSVFHPDAVMDHLDHVCGPEEFVTLAMQFLRSVGTTGHYLAQVHIELDGDRAQTETYGLAYHRLRTPAGEAIDSLMGARILERYERRAGQWKIMHRKTVPEWNLDLPAGDTWGKGAFGPPPILVGRKDRTDPSYDRR